MLGSEAVVLFGNLDYKAFKLDKVEVGGRGRSDQDRSARIWLRSDCV